LADSPSLRLPKVDSMDSVYNPMHGTPGQTEVCGLRAVPFKIFVLKGRMGALIGFCISGGAANTLFWRCFLRV
jgi:hypothetical protein